MPRDFLHNHRQFADLIRIVADDRHIVPTLVEKDYWIMQSLYGLQQLDLAFQLKGGTSFSEGYGLIHRFSEDIDIRTEPPADWKVMAGRNHDKPAHAESRKAFFDRLAQTIHIDGIQATERDAAFDDAPGIAMAASGSSMRAPMDRSTALRTASCSRWGSTTSPPTRRRPSAPGLTTSPPAGSRSSTTEPSPSLATTQAAPWSKSCRRSRPGFGSSR